MNEENLLQLIGEALGLHSGQLEPDSKAEDYVRVGFDGDAVYHDDAGT